MINQILDLNNKTEELERYIKNVEKQQSQALKNSTCESFVKNFSNVEIIGTKRLFLTTLQAQKNEKLFFQCLIDLQIVSSDYVYFSLLANGVAIQKYRKKLQDGESQISILQNYEPLATENIDIYLEITPKNETSVKVGQVSLFVWGNFKEKSQTNYQIIETQDKYLLSFLSDNMLYCKLTDKICGEYSFIDFETFGEASSYSFVYLPNSKKIYLFRVDSQKNLHLVDFITRNESFVCSNVTNVSAVSSNQDDVLISIISDSDCYYFEMSASLEFSTIKKIEYDRVKLVSSICIFDKNNNEFFIVLNGKKNDNYLVKAVSDTNKCIENISAEYLISVETYNLEDENGN